MKTKSLLVVSVVVVLGGAGTWLFNGLEHYAQTSSEPMNRALELASNLSDEPRFRVIDSRSQPGVDDPWNAGHGVPLTERPGFELIFHATEGGLPEK